MINLSIQLYRLLAAATPHCQAGNSNTRFEIARGDSIPTYMAQMEYDAAYRGSARAPRRRMRGARMPMACMAPLLSIIMS